MATTAFLAVVRLIFPSVAKPSYTVKEKTSLNDTTHTQSVISRVTNQQMKPEQKFNLLRQVMV